MRGNKQNYKARGPDYFSASSLPRDFPRPFFSTSPLLRARSTPFPPLWKLLAHAFLRFLSLSFRGVSGFRNQETRDVSSLLAHVNLQSVSREPKAQFPKTEGFSRRAIEKWLHLTGCSRCGNISLSVRSRRRTSPICRGSPSQTPRIRRLFSKTPCIPIRS